MGERAEKRPGIREIFSGLRARIFGSPVTPSEDTTEPPRQRRMWEILNKIPLIELDKLTPAERMEFVHRAQRDLLAQIELQDDLNLTPREFFAKISSSGKSRA